MGGRGGARRPGEWVLGGRGSARRGGNSSGSSGGRNDDGERGSSRGGWDGNGERGGEATAATTAAAMGAGATTSRAASGEYDRKLAHASSLKVNVEDKVVRGEHNRNVAQTAQHGKRHQEERRPPETDRAHLDQVGHMKQRASTGTSTEEKRAEERERERERDQLPHPRSHTSADGNGRARPDKHHFRRHSTVRSRPNLGDRRTGRRRRRNCGGLPGTGDNQRTQ